MKLFVLLSEEEPPSSSDATIEGTFSTIEKAQNYARQCMRTVAAESGVRKEEDPEMFLWDDDEVPLDFESRASEFYRKFGVSYRIITSILDQE
jgi:hypothetical protein